MFEVCVDGGKHSPPPGRTTTHTTNTDSTFWDAAFRTSEIPNICGRSVKGVAERGPPRLPTVCCLPADEVGGAEVRQQCNIRRARPTDCAMGTRPIGEPQALRARVHHRCHPISVVQTMIEGEIISVCPTSSARVNTTTRSRAPESKSLSPKPSTRRCMLETWGILRHRRAGETAS